MSPASIRLTDALAQIKKPESVGKSFRGDSAALASYLTDDGIPQDLFLLYKFHHSGIEGFHESLRILAFLIRPFNLPAPNSNLPSVSRVRPRQAKTHRSKAG
jgi:hypothetical protein